MGAIAFNSERYSSKLYVTISAEERLFLWILLKLEFHSILPSAILRENEYFWVNSIII